MIIQIFYRGLDDPNQEILDAGGIFLYKTPNEAFKILGDKVLLKLDFSRDPHINSKPKTIVSTGGNNVNSDHASLMEKFEALARKNDFEFLFIRKERKEIYPTISPFLKDNTMHIPYTKAKTFADDVLMNQVGDEEFKLSDGIEVLVEKEIKKNDNGVPKELNKE
ncbi:hypothetical protein Tco_0797328 [Tanacetum coccineum]